MPANDDEAYRGPTIPAPMGEQLRRTLGLDDRPRTFGDWVESIAVVTDRDGIEPTLDALCTTDASPHRATFDGRTQHYRCVQDAFIVPFLADDVDRVDIETQSPVSGDPIAITVAESGVEVDPDGTVTSFGVDAAVEPPAGGPSSAALAYRHVCPYGHAFAAPAEYERWAADTDAHTMRVSVADTLAFARAIGRAV